MIRLKGTGIGRHGLGSDSQFTAYRTLHRETAALGQGMSISGAGANNLASSDGFLTGVMQDTQGQTMLKAYRDMYHYDAICGTAVDLQALLPFSNFDLYGVSEDRLDVYNSAIAALNLRQTAPVSTRHYLTESSYTATLVYDPKTKRFIDQIPYNLENLKLDYSPLISQDPIITAKVDARYRKYLDDSGEEYEQARKAIPAQLLEALRGGEFILDPLSTLHLSRRVFFSEEPVSYLRRCLPIYLIEKLLFRGNLFEAGRRQRANVHVAAGDDVWEPTPEELQNLVSLFQMSDLDPMGAIVATRNGININEWRSGGDFWRWSDQFDQFASIKMKALGISDALLSSESSYNNADTALTVLMESFNAYRDYWTHAVCTNRIFPVIALVHGFNKDGDKSKQTAGTGPGIQGLRRVNDYSQLDIPRVRWQKRLTVDNDANLFERLEKLQEHNVPIPFRLWIAASGLDADTILNEWEDDENLQRKLDKYKPKDMDGDDGMGGLSDMMQASLFKGIPLRKRDFGDANDYFERTRTGKKKHVINQRAHQRRANEQIAKAAGRLADANYQAAVIKNLTAKDRATYGVLK